ncbi:hypothetical protein pb186bvf_002372 [Paramecium bursaria]
MHRKLSSLLTHNSKTKSFNASIPQDANTLPQLSGYFQRIVEGKPQDLNKINEAIQQLAGTLERCSQQEIELNYKTRLLIKQQQEYKDLEQKHNVLLSKLDETLKQNKSLLQRIDELSSFNQTNFHKIQLSQKTAGDLNHKVSNLEQRLEIILESDFAVDQVNIRRTLTDLVKESERQKRDIQMKNQEIQRLKEQVKQFQQRVNKLNQKVETMKKKISVRELENLTYDRQDVTENQDKQTDPTNIMNRNQPCENLDFRINALKLEFADIINDISEQGTQVFAAKFLQLNQKQQKEQIQLISSQYVSFKDCAEKLNLTIKYSIQLLTLKTLSEQLQFIDQNAKHIFMSTFCRLWILDAQQGILYTFNQSNEEIRVILNKGAFAEVLRFQKPIHKRDFSLLCEQTNRNQISTNQSLLYPLFNQNNHLAAILEISNSVSDYFSFDEEYYGVIFSKICEQILKIQLKNRLMEVTLNYNGLLHDAFHNFLQAQNRFELFKLIKNWSSSILTVAQMAFYFVDNQGRMVTFDQNQKEKSFLLQGLAGMVAKRQKQLIVMNIRQAIEFDETVDIDTILPVLIYPIISEQEERTIANSNKIGEGQDNDKQFYYYRFGLKF